MHFWSVKDRSHIEVYTKIKHQQIVTTTVKYCVRYCCSELPISRTGTKYCEG